MAGSDFRPMSLKRPMSELAEAEAAEAETTLQVREYYRFELEVEDRLPQESTWLGLLGSRGKVEVVAHRRRQAMKWVPPKDYLGPWPR